MKKVLLVALLAFFAVSTVDAKTKYKIKKLATGLAVNVDGFPTEWNESYFIDSLHSDDNVYARSTCLGEWNPKWYQYKLYLAYDDEWIYGVGVTTRDSAYVLRTTGWAGSGDNMKLNIGGQAQAFYIPNDGAAPVTNPSCPFQSNVNMFARARTYGNLADSLPTYEFKFKKEIVIAFEGQTEFDFSFGSEEVNSVCADESGFFLAVGAEYTGFKQNWSGNPWDQATYYPTFTLDTAKGIEAEKSVRSVTVTTLSANPNPFLPATTISYTAQNDGVVKIFDAAGKLIRSEAVKAGAGKVHFNGTSLASGVYVARLESGKTVVNTKLFLTR
ncbi:MAG: T9SS type A sorting domain-containing protein [Fibrobacteres bacterium]|nr:T9SS type A sorting domain-containing protein [Fibrobacterota bacterium]